MAKISFAALIAGAAASRSQEGVAYLQTGSMEQRLTSITDADTDSGARRAHRLLSMKDQIVSFAQSDVPEAARPFLNTISDSLQNDVLPEILAERNAVLQTHDSLFSAFGTASGTYTTAMAGLPPDGTTEKTAHSTCRDAESVDHHEAEVCDGEQVAAHIAFMGDQTTVLALGADHDVCDDGWTTSAAVDLQAYITAGDAAILSRAALESKTVECNGLNGDLVAKNAECDGLQTAYEAVACTRAQAVKGAGDQYMESYNTARGLFEAEFAVWQAQEENRVKQCRLVKTLVCYVAALHDYDDKAALQGEVDTCDADHDTHDCGDMTFTVSNAPAPLELTPVPAAPCQASFDYGAFPSGTSEGTCTPCSGL